ncbi:SMI1/KNR4 family protein [Micromonospora sp. 4G55]|uniref:SMI1/KNR4 family protein n=1 Tax=Micromonospora sp. 4G55 TaxID=2806102 RepID=UPI001A5BCD2E|nr:SMI1/KNR4 family protein [Micromonospora sp. 4G55]MBM0257094.1 SMI1/KNR4 family protein [Micromonospora sp. 4G55]MBM0259483.1 SMI1/KNR4 family protein [Micromonospora sp. 4G55]
MAAAQVDALTRIMPPTHGADEEVDWDAAEKQLSARLPADYRAFMAVYGGGSIGGQLSILLPLPVDSVWGGGTIAGETPNLRHHWEEEGGVAGTELEADAVLAWGVGCSNPDLLGWLMSGSDPDQWPVVVYRRHVSWGEPSLALFECGMAEFLRRLLLGEFDKCPLSDVSLWGRIEPFVHWREQDRRFLAGLDPITGEPDPYADMFQSWSRP